MLAMLFIVFMVLISDLITVYAVDLQVRGALLNAVDGATTINMDPGALTHADMDAIREEAGRVFYARLQDGLELDADFKNERIFRHGVRVEHLYVGWHNNQPLVRAEVSVRIDTMLLQRFLPEAAEVRVNNFDHLYWRWS
jgi:hypothetical protein